MGSTKSGGKWPEQRELFRDRRDHLDDQGALRLIQALALDVPRPRNHRSVVAVQNVQTAGATEMQRHRESEGAVEEPFRLLSSWHRRVAIHCRKTMVLPTLTGTDYVKLLDCKNLSRRFFFMYDF